MSTVKYRREDNLSYRKDGVKHVVKESIIDGEKGLSFHYLMKSGDNQFHSITVRQDGDKYSVRQKVDDKSEEMELDLTGLNKMIKDSKELDFVSDYLKNRSKYNGRRRKSLKGGAKKSSKKLNKLEMAKESLR